MQYFGLEKKMEAREMIAIRGLTKTFGLKADAVTALRNIDLSIREGEIFGIIGLSGAGKSTLVRCMNYLEHPTEGSVAVDGKKLGALNKKELLEARRGIGMIFQQFNLLDQRNAALQEEINLLEEQIDVTTRSIAANEALEKAMHDVETGAVQPVPEHLKNVHVKAIGAERNDSYKYPHAYKDAWVKQAYLRIPETYYIPSDQGYEATIAKRMEMLKGAF